MCIKSSSKGGDDAERDFLVVESCILNEIYSRVNQLREFEIEINIFNSF